MLWKTVEILFNAFQSCLLIYFMNSKITILPSKKKYALCVITASTTFLSLHSHIVFPIPDSFIFIFPFLYAFFCSKDGFLLSSFWSITLAILFSTTVNLLIDITTSIPAIMFEQFLLPSWQRGVYLLCTNLILCTVIRAAAKINYNKSSVSWSVLLTFLASLILIFYIEEALYQFQFELEMSQQFQFSSSQFSLLYIALICCTILIILLFQSMMSSCLREATYRSELIAIAQQKHHYEEMEQFYSDIKLKLHDFRHHIQTLETLVNSSHEEVTQTYLEVYRKKLDNLLVFDTGCPAFDALLTTKYIAMESKKISFKYWGYPLNDLPILIPDFCAMLGNLLDNAIEGVERIKESSSERYIDLKFSRSRDMFYIYCSNTYNPETVKKKNKRWISSKEHDPISHHGLGISNIEKIVYESAGHCCFECNEEIFYSKISIPYRNNFLKKEEASWKN